MKIIFNEIYICKLLLILLFPILFNNCVAQEETRPNIILVLTDDQGYGDLGVHGNEIINTPNIDKFAKASIQLSQFYVSPVCSPTRASLMTGRYNFRTRVVDTYKGRSMIDPEEYTLAEALNDAGYSTGIFGKWHLGDNYPMRSNDQGFDESVVHQGGGLAQPSGPVDNGYFDPILLHNGKEKKYFGYCMDIYTNESMRFIEENKNNPFFVYIATNTPHGPLQVSEKYYKPYMKKGEKENTARLYGMVENIDDNFGKLMNKLDELGLTDNTIVIFMTDNGPAMHGPPRFNSDLRGAKGSVYDGGIRVPFFLSWPKQFKKPKTIETIAAHIDIMPTLLAACDVLVNENAEFDGVNLFPLLNDEKIAWHDRTFYTQWHRGDEPQLYRCFSARNQKYKLVQAAEQPGFEYIQAAETMKFELFDMENDPSEKNDISAENLDIVNEIRQNYTKWFYDVSSTRGYDPPRIFIGAEEENPAQLSQQDWRGSQAWGDNDLGYWLIKVIKEGRYNIKLTLSKPLKNDALAHIKIGNVEKEKVFFNSKRVLDMGVVKLEKGDMRIDAWLAKGQKKVGVRFVDIESIK